MLSAGGVLALDFLWFGRVQHFSQRQIACAAGWFQLGGEDLSEKAWFRLSLHK